MRCINFPEGNEFYCFCNYSSDDDRETNSEEIFNCGFCSFKTSDLRRMRHHID